MRNITLLHVRDWTYYRGIDFAVLTVSGIPVLKSRSKPSALPLPPSGFPKITTGTPPPSPISLPSPLPQQGHPPFRPPLLCPPPSHNRKTKTPPPPIKAARIPWLASFGLPCQTPPARPVSPSPSPVPASRSGHEARLPRGLLDHLAGGVFESESGSARWGSTDEGRGSHLQNGHGFIRPPLESSTEWQGLTYLWLFQPHPRNFQGVVYSLCPLVSLISFPGGEQAHMEGP